jgi:hypothetical protein
LDLAVWLGVGVRHCKKREGANEKTNSVHQEKSRKINRMSAGVKQESKALDDRKQKTFTCCSEVCVHRAPGRHLETMEFPIGAKSSD